MTVTSETVDTFRQFTKTCIETHSGPDALEMICQAHEAALTGARAQATTHQQEAEHALRNAKLRSDMLYHVHRVLGSELQRGAQLYAHLTLSQSIVEQVRLLAAQADGGTVPVADIVKAMGTALPAIQRGPFIVAYVPDTMYDAGHFATPDQVVIRSFPFTGWMLLSPFETAEQAMQPAFLVDNGPIPRSTIETRFGMQLQHLT